MPYLGEIVVIMAVSVAIAYVCRRIRLVPIVGFILAGVLIGPHALALVPDQQLVSNLAEIGVILLLFTIGVELSLQKLARLRRFILVGGGIQSTVLVGIVHLLMLSMGIEWRTALFTAFLVVLSSTAIVLKLLSDRAMVDSPAGQVSVALLVFQDLAMVGMVLLVPALSGGGSPLGIGWAMIKAVAIVGVALMLASRAIPWLLEKVAEARGQELFLLTVVAICFGTAWLTNLAGVSLALGAFLAGLVVSESRYRGYALSEVLPLRTIFNAVFFVSIGMLLDMGFVVQNLSLVLGGAIVVFVLKSVVTGGTVLALGYPVRIAAVSGLALAQICETSFVLERVGSASGMSPAGMAYAGEQTFIAVTVLLMLATPFSLQAGPRLGAFLETTPLGRRRKWDLEPHRDDFDRLENHVVVIGYGPAGRSLVQTMREAGIPYVIIELNAYSVTEMEQHGERVIYGDAGRPHILEIAGIERAKICAIAINDPAAAGRIVELANFMNPTIEIVVRARFVTDVEELRHSGATAVIPDEMVAALAIVSKVLRSYRVPRDQVRAVRSRIRSQVLGGAAVPKPDVRISEVGMQIREVAVREGALAANVTLEELALRRSHGLTVLAIHRNGSRIQNPSGEHRVLPGDRLVVTGPSEGFTRSAHLFRTNPR
ncbi:MAG TPA: cation:proton antiporter [Rhodothermales bacterium]